MAIHSVGSIVGYFLARYDHNRNGRIDLPQNQTTKEQVEVNGVSYRRDTSKVYVPDELLTGSGFPHATEQAFMRAADENTDGAATVPEMRKLVSQYDKNGDGNLEGRGFWGQFMGLFGIGRPGELEIFGDDFGGP